MPYKGAGSSDNPYIATPEFINGTIDSVGLCSGAFDLVRYNVQNANLTNVAWPASNRAIFVPIAVPNYFVVKNCFWLNNVLSGNVDFGIYDISGKRLASIGSTAQAGSGLLQSASLSLAMSPGLYFLAMAADNTTGAYNVYAPTSLVQLQSVCGVQQMATAFPLPSTATFANPSSGYIPFMGITPQSVV